MLINLTAAGVFRPCERKWAALYDIVLIISGSFLIGLCAQVKIWLPFSPVPVTGQTFAVLMMGTLFGARRGCLCVLAYLTEGIAGLPVFAAAGGPAALAGPTGGYLIGFLAAAYITGLLAEKGWDRRVGTTIVAMLLGNAVIYAFGLARLACLMGINKTILTVGLYPFVPGDILKTILAAAILPAGWKLLKEINLPTKRINGGSETTEKHQ